MPFSLDIYGRRSLENRFVFYLTALVLMMMTFLATIVTSEAYRAFREEAAQRAKFAVDRVDAAGPAAHAPGAILLDPSIVLVAEGRPGQGPVTLAGASIADWKVPVGGAWAFDARSVTGDGRAGWGFLEKRGDRDFIVIVDSVVAMGHLRLIVGTLIWITGLALVVHSFLALVMARAVLRPIRQFIGALHKVTQGKFGFALDVREQDELGDLKSTFNYMQTQLQEKEMIERQLAFHQHMATVGQLAAGVAHEIRNPLASISSLTQMIGSDGQAGAKTQEYAKVILREIQRMDGSIQQLLNFARPVTPEFAPGSLRHVCENVIRLMEHDARARSVELKLDVDWANEFPMLMDASKLEQLLINLVKNGLEAISGPGRISLGLAYDEDADHAILTVEDDGPGMAESLKDGAFDVFYTTKRGGSGLGLAIVSRLVALHNGQITVDTELNRGTRFTIRLPRLKPETAAKLSGGTTEGTIPRPGTLSNSTI
jgi:signal transduction histidine kinase